MKTLLGRTWGSRVNTNGPTDLVACVICQARNDGSLGEAAIAKDGQLGGWILAF